VLHTEVTPATVRTAHFARSSQIAVVLLSFEDMPIVESLPFAVKLRLLSASLEPNGMEHTSGVRRSPLSDWNVVRAPLPLVEMAINACCRHWGLHSPFRKRPEVTAWGGYHFTNEFRDTGTRGVGSQL